MAVKTADALKASFPQSDPQDFAEDIVDSFSALASETVAGNVELATAAEAVAGSDTQRAVTPAGLAAAVPAASATVAGKVELATNIETKAVTDQGRAVTPYGLGAALASLSIISFQGSNLAGPCTATGLLVGDVLFAITGAQAGVVGDLASKFEGTVTVDDQIQQTAAENLSGNTYMALVYRRVDPA